MYLIDIERITTPPRSLNEAIESFILYCFITLPFYVTKPVFLLLGKKTGIPRKQGFPEQTSIVFIEKGFVLRLKGKNRFIE